MRAIDRYWHLRDKERAALELGQLSFPSMCAWPLVEPRDKRWVLGFTGVVGRLLVGLSVGRLEGTSV